jgi:hypothetical protein
MVNGFLKNRQPWQIPKKISRRERRARRVRARMLAIANVFYFQGV